MGLRLDALKSSKQMEQDIFGIEYDWRESLMRENVEKIWNQFFGICMKKHLTLDKNELTVAGLTLCVAGLTLCVAGLTRSGRFLNT